MNARVTPAFLAFVAGCLAGGIATAWTLHPSLLYWQIMLGGKQDIAKILSNTTYNVSTSSKELAAQEVAAREAASAQEKKEADERKQWAASTIASHLDSKGEFTILLDLLKTSEYLAMLKSPGNYTLFAPTDAAFKKLLKPDLSDLKDPKHGDVLKSLIGYHLLNGNFLLKNIAGRKGAPNMLEGEVLNIDATNSNVKAGAAYIQSKDDDPANGVIYVVDNVLVPPSLAKTVSVSTESSPPPPEKPVDKKAVEQKPIETKPVAAKSVETKPIETKPVENKSAVIPQKPVEQTKPTEPIKVPSAVKLPMPTKTESAPAPSLPTYSLPSFTTSPLKPVFAPTQTPLAVPAPDAKKPDDTKK